MKFGNILGKYLHDYCVSVEKYLNFYLEQSNPESVLKVSFML